MRILLNHVRRYDWLLMGAIFLLMALGLLTLFSLDSVSTFPFFERQIFWVGLGLLSLFSVSLIDFRIFRTQSFVVLLVYFAAVVLLVAVLLGDFAVRGVEAWVRVGIFSLQPSEFAKLALVILLAKFFSKRHVEIYRLRHLIVSGIYFLIPAALVLLQPDLGSAIVLGSIWVAAVVFSGIKLRHFVALLVLVAILSAVAWTSTLAPYQKDRITAYLNPYADPQGAGYQMIQSMIAVGSGQLWGKGLGYGSQSHLNFLPEAETDFIFAAFAEEWGFVGMAILLTLIFIVLWRIVLISMRSSDNFSRLFTLGLAALIFVQSFIHIGMNMGVMPIAGLTLPFVSYGGSSLITLLIGVGVAQNIKINSRREIE